MAPMKYAKSLRLLLVDDSDTFLAVLRSALGAVDGVEIAGEARSGEQAVAMAEVRAPDVVIMDLAMPGIGGIEATRILKSLPRPPRVVVLTLHQDDGYRQAAVAAGADFFIAKDRLFDDFPLVLAALKQP